MLQILQTIEIKVGKNTYNCLDVKLVLPKIWILINISVETKVWVCLKRCNLDGNVYFKSCLHSR